MDFVENCNFEAGFGSFILSTQLNTNMTITKKIMVTWDHVLNSYVKYQYPRLNTFCSAAFLVTEVLSNILFEEMQGKDWSVKSIGMLEEHFAVLYLLNPFKDFYE